MGAPLISWLAASTSIFRRSNNGCNVVVLPLLFVSPPLFLSFSLLFLSAVEMIALPTIGGDGISDIDFTSWEGS